MKAPGRDASSTPWDDRADCRVRGRPASGSPGPAGAAVNQARPPRSAAGPAQPGRPAGQAGGGCRSPGPPEPPPGVNSRAKRSLRLAEAAETWEKDAGWWPEPRDLGVQRAVCHFSATQDPRPIFGPGWLPEKEHAVISPTLHSLTEAFFQGGSPHSQQVARKGHAQT